MQAPNVGNYSLGKGILYFDRVDVNGTSTGELDLGNAPVFAITPNTETLAHFESRSGIKEKDLEVEVSAGFTGKITLDEYSKENLVFAFRGDTPANTTQGDGTVTDESIVAHLARWIKLLYRKASNIVVTNVGGTVTYVEDTDYRVDETVGRVYIIDGGAITEGQTLYVDYDYAAASYPTVQALTRSEVAGSLRFVGDPTIGQAYEVVVHKVRVKCDGDVNFISDDWGIISLSFEILKDAAGHPSSPWFEVLSIDEDAVAGS
jgi:hypothetical protein